MNSKTLKQLVPGSSAKVRGSNLRAGGSNPAARGGGGKAHAAGVARRALASRAEANGNPALSSPSLPDDIAALFADARPTTTADLSQLERAAEALLGDPKFVADHAKGLIIEDILRAMEAAGMTRNALAGKIGKSRQYVSKILDEDRRVNFTIDSLAEFSAALGIQLCLRMLPESERILFIRRLAPPVEIACADQFPDESIMDSAMPEPGEFVPRNIIPFTEDTSYERASLSA